MAPPVGKPWTLVAAFVLLAILAVVGWKIYGADDLAPAPVKTPPPPSLPRSERRRRQPAARRRAELLPHRAAARPSALLRQQRRARHLAPLALVQRLGRF